ncbi:Uncharacterised protein [Pantoea agglomerans]|uniref:Uncharacterized protein n=1 Tax=Enterobacter agglomerans TaxID=549 RepID=A0A379ACJ9_ENTAG|nr:Uncharacterised protein [Pantoea agglomerans]
MSDMLSLLLQAVEKRLLRPAGYTVCPTGGPGITAWAAARCGLRQR